MAVFKSAAQPQAISEEVAPLHFRRKDGLLQTKKIQRKLKLRFSHILLSFIALVALFFGIHKACLFLLTWKKMDIRNVSIVSANAEIKETIRKDLERTSLGNLFLFDVQDLQEKLAFHPRVKYVHIRKTLPPALVITVEERQPFAVVMSAEQLNVIDNEGVIIDRLDALTEEWPLLLDEKNFDSYYLEKIGSARECLESLSAGEQKTIAQIDLSEHMNIKVLLKNSSTWLYLGSDFFAEKLRRFQASKSRLQQYGYLEYVDLRFDQRFFIKVMNSARDVAASGTEKEGD